MMSMGGPIVPLFHVPKYDNDGFRVPGPKLELYGLGPDPIKYLNGEYPVDEVEGNKEIFCQEKAMEVELTGKEQAILQIAKLCLFTRKKLIPNIMHSMQYVKKDWSSLFSKKSLVGTSSFYSACVDYFIRKHPEFFSNISVIFHDTQLLFRGAKKGHVFLLAKIKNHETMYIIDLTARGLIQSVRFTPSETEFFNDFLAKGFFEVNPQNFSLYQCFFQSYREEYYSDIKTGMQREWEWFVDENTLKLNPIVSMKTLEQATSKIDYDDDELKDFLNPW